MRRYVNWQREDQIVTLEFYVLTLGIDYVDLYYLLENLGQIL